MSRHLIQRSARTSVSIPLFLAPAFSNACASTVRGFSSSTATQDQPQRGNRDMSRKRGVSAIRSTGPRQALGVMKHGPLPTPAQDYEATRAMFETNPDHGLWGFFNENKEALIPSSEEDSHGRPWTRKELSQKGWHDLHMLYWVCVKELNVVRTRQNERKRLRAGYGEQEGDAKLKNVKRTMHRIRQVLVDRHYATFDASLLLEEKLLVEIFPDKLKEYLPEDEIALDHGTNEDLSATESLSPDGGLAAKNAFDSAGVSEVGKHAQRQKVSE